MSLGLSLGINIRTRGGAGIPEVSTKNIVGDTEIPKNTVGDTEVPKNEVGDTE